MASFDADSFDVNSFDVDSFFLSATAVSSGLFVEGTLVDSVGTVQIVPVDRDHIPVSSDVYILGTLHRNDGSMYVSTGAPAVGDVHINSIWHTPNGVRLVSFSLTTDTGVKISKGFTCSPSGVQYMDTTVSGNVAHGILRNTNSEVVTNDNT